ncbi:MAG: 6-phosphogluconolactonase [Methylacidiphilales bacterium]|nr:6-phosphogluconolactonase [Candidatus Methylacidiphilales bacterium]MDW8350096.1 6-phosphogluconolactonase [Verrucomicrobiae bacterium]
MIDLIKLPAPAALDTLVAGILRITQQPSPRSTTHIALAGGSTPAPFYRALNQCDTLPWSQIHWWIGDERTVPPDHPDSNEKMIRSTLGHARPNFHLHSWHLDSDLVKAAEKMHALLTQTIGTPPVFDLILLGLGNDGHTASLFPNTNALQERHRYAVSNPVPQLKTQRWTFTYPVLEAAKEIWFLVQGTSKTEMVHKLLARDHNIPAARIQNPHQKIYWIL